eukprot:18301-Eustigmatos_ZCMA.PRE.1
MWYKRQGLELRQGRLTRSRSEPVFGGSHPDQTGAGQMPSTGSWVQSGWPEPRNAGRSKLNRVPPD